jgi:hypothetical protein
MQSIGGQQPASPSPSRSDRNGDEECADQYCSRVAQVPFHSIAINSQSSDTDTTESP